MSLISKNNKSLRFLFIEPFFGGSHKLFAEGFAEHSAHNIDLLTLPGKNFGWRIKGAAIYFAKKINQLSDYDGLIVTDLMRLTDLKALSKSPLPKTIVYFHENQMSYPLAPGDKRDYSACMADIATALCADRVVFNSDFHRRSFFESLPLIIDRAPDFPISWAIEEIKQKSCYIYPGCDLEKVDESMGDDGDPLIIWNHRWAFDKNSGDFFNVLEKLRESGFKFRLALLGRSEPRIPKVFEQGLALFKEQIVFAGYAESREDYISWLKKGDIVISTAKQENFGIAVIEAIFHGCFPLLPDRLSYPEIIPEKYKGKCLYRSKRELILKLQSLLENKSEIRNQIKGIENDMELFAWGTAISRFDDELKKLAAM